MESWSYSLDKGQLSSTTKDYEESTQVKRNNPLKSQRESFFFFLGGDQTQEVRKLLIERAHQRSC